MKTDWFSDTSVGLYLEKRDRSPLLSNAHLMHDNGHEGLRSSDITKEAGSETAGKICPDDKDKPDCMFSSIITFREDLVQC